MKIVFLILIALYAVYTLITKGRLLIRGIQFSQKQYDWVQIKKIACSQTVYEDCFSVMKRKIIRIALISIFFHSAIISIFTYTVLRFF